MVQEHWQQLKMKFYQVITWKSLFSGEDLSKRRKMSIFLANHVQILSWKPLPLIYLSATSCWFLKEENFYPNKFLQTIDNVFPTVNENKFLLWNYSYSDKSVFLKFESYYCNFQGNKVFTESYTMDQLQKCYRNIHIKLLKVFISYDFLVKYRIRIYNYAIWRHLQRWKHFIDDILL